VPFLDLESGVKLYYQDYRPEKVQGSKARSVLLLHGLGANGDSWLLQVPALTANGFRVLAPDLRGFGRSSYPGRISVPDMAADMAGLLQALQTGPAHVVGISMGGTVALQLALDYPDLVDRLVLVSTFARLQPYRLAGWFYFALRLILVHTLGLPSQARAITWRVFPKPEQEALRQALYEQILQANPEAYKGAILALARFNVQPRLAQVRVPTLIVTGDEDTTIYPSNQRALLAIPGSRQVVIPGGGHGVIADHAAEFNQVLLDFLTIPESPDSAGRACPGRPRPPTG